MGQIAGMVLKRGAKLLAAGIALGVISSIVATRLLKGYVWNLTAFESLDPWTITTVALLLTMVALLACWMPARRATKVDPIIALRTE